MKSQYDVERKKFSDIEGSIDVPKYQRRLVWSRTQKEDFIDNVSKGYPFGSILLYRYENSTRLSLIDGLQRYSAMTDFKKNPSKYFKDYGIYIDEIINHINAPAHVNLSESQEVDIRQKLDDIFQAYLSESNPKPIYLRDAITKEATSISVYPSDSDSADKLIDIQARLNSDIDSFLDLENVVIPCIIFEGEESMLPDVFANLNRGGTKLSKYQVLAATWHAHSISLHPDQIGDDLLERVIDRYADLETNRNLQIDDFDKDEMYESRTINLPEFCFALGDKIIESVPVFWKGLKDRDLEKREDICNVIGYLSTAIALNVDNRKLDGLPKKIELFQEPEFVSALVREILSIYKVLNEEFAKWLRIPGTSDSTHYETTAITDMQILSFFASLFHKKYHINEDSKSINIIDNYRNTGFEQIRKNLISYCICDIVANVWQGSGDSRLANYYVADANGKLSYYVMIDPKSIESRLLNWLDTVSGKASINIEKVSRTLLCLQSNINSWQFDADQYDVEHIVSRQKLKKNNAYVEGNIPGGTLGNLMYLKPKTNRGKQGNNLYAVTDNEGVVFTEEYLEKMKYPDRITIDGAEEQLEEGNYDPVKAFISERAKDIIKDISIKISPLQRDYEEKSVSNK